MDERTIWTNKKPEKGGYYWHRENSSDIDPNMAYVVLFAGGDGLVEWPSHLETDILKVEGEWWGPLEPPK